MAIVIGAGPLMVIISNILWTKIGKNFEKKLNLYLLYFENGLTWNITLLAFLLNQFEFYIARRVGKNNGTSRNFAVFDFKC